MFKNLETYTEVAIRLKKSSISGGGYNYITYREDGSRNPGPTSPLTIEAAKRQLSLYTSTAEATIVTREVEKSYTDWETVEMSEVKLLAEILHKKRCNANHIDQCNWEMDATSSTHKKFETIAEEMLAMSPFENIKKLLELL